jgi:hypothetical protein
MVSGLINKFFKASYILELGKSEVAQGDGLSFLTRHMSEFFRLRNKPELIE